MSVKVANNKEFPRKILTRDGKEANSVFHVPLPAPSCGDCAEGLGNIIRFADSLKQLCGAGTQAADKLSSLLVGTSYREIAGQFLLLQQHLDGAMDGVVSQIKAELEGCLKQLNRDDNQKNNKDETHRPDDLQVLAMGLVLMLQLQQQFFITATEKLACFSQSHALNNTNGLTIDTKLLPPGVNRGISQSVSPPAKYAGHQAVAKTSSDPESRGRKSPNDGAGTKGTSTPPGGWFNDREAGSSLDGQAPSGDKPQSAGQIGSQPDVKTKGQGHGQGQMNLPRKNPTIQLPKETSGNFVSEEEIDVVIDMLSRSTKYTTPPGSVDSDEVPKAPPTVPNPPVPPPTMMSRAPGSQLVTSSQPVTTPAPTASTTHKYATRAVQHRQSDSFIADARISSDNKTNTWPFRPRQRENMPVWQGVEYAQAGMYNPQCGYDAMAYHEAMFGTKQSLIPGISAGPWSSATDGTTNRAWPVFPHIGDGEQAPRQWSAMADSSSCSDESSSNSDMQWMMGTHLMDAVNVKRRHSSGGGDTAAPPGGPHTNHINKSVDCLAEPRSMNTWPPKQPWGNKPLDEPLGGDTVDMMKGVHKPLMPQWSDPLATQPLAVWDAGLIGSLSQQSFGNMSGGGGTEYHPIGLVNSQQHKRF